MGALRWDASLSSHQKEEDLKITQLLCHFLLCETHAPGAGISRQKDRSCIQGTSWTESVQQNWQMHKGDTWMLPTAVVRCLLMTNLREVSLNIEVLFLSSVKATGSLPTPSMSFILKHALQICLASSSKLVIKLCRVVWMKCFGQA